MKPKFSIKLNYTLFVVLLIILILGFNTFLTIQNQTKIIRQEIIKRASGIAKKLANDLKDPILTDDDLTIFSMMDSMKKEKDMLYVMILDRFKIPIAHSDTKWLTDNKAPLTDEITRNSFNANKLFIQDVLYLGNNAFDVSYPVMVNQKKLGLVRVGFSKRPIEVVIQNITFKTLTVALIAILLGIVATYLLTSYILYPIQSLMDGAERVSKGNFNHDITVKQKNEFMVLANTFNHMQKSIKQMMDEVAEKEALKRELTIASSIQQTLIPKESPKIQNLDITGYNCPAEQVGGDYYDFFEINEHSLGTIIADVSGHGISAALIMVMLSIIFKINISKIPSPADIVLFANNFLIHEVLEEKFVTMIYYTYDVLKRELIFCNAGHLPIMIYHHQEKIIEEIESTNIPVGIMSDTPFVNMKATCNPQDLIITFTDGFIEAKDEQKEQFGLKRLKDLIIENNHLTSNQLIEKIIDEVNHYCPDKTAADDKTIIIMRV